MARNTSRIVVGGGIAASVVAGATYGLANLMFSYALDAQAKHSMLRSGRDDGKVADKGPRLDAAEEVEAADWFDQSKQPVVISAEDGASSFMAGCSIPIAPVRSPTCMRYAATGIRGNRRIWRSTRIVSPVSGSPCWFRRCAATGSAKAAMRAWDGWTAVT